MHIPAVLLLMLLTVDSSWTASILHGMDGTAQATSYQSLVRGGARTSRILNWERQRLERRADEEQAGEQHIIRYHTPAHLTFAARPVLHQMLPQIRPVRNLSYASLEPSPRSLS